MNNPVKYVASVLCLLLASSLFAEERQLAPHLLKGVDASIAKAMDEHGIPGLSVAVAVENQLLLSRGYGKSDVENNISVTAETKFRTASIAKSMTAVAIMSLADEGKIDLDAEVQEYCSSYPKKRWPVTTRQLLGHLGGVRHYKSAAETTSTKHYFTLSSALETFKDDPLSHEPGSKYLYTTFGYNLLGNVAEGASRKNFVELLDQRIFAPAKMRQTVADNQFAIIPNRSRGYIRPKRSSALYNGLVRWPSKAVEAEDVKEPTALEGHRTGLYNAPLHDTSMKIPGGGLLSTAGDLVRFAIALNGDQILSPESREEMWTSQSINSGKETGYGLGWRVSKRRGRKQVWHTGGQAGTSTILLLVPETGTTVAIMCNLQSVQLLSLATTIADSVSPPAPYQGDYIDAVAKLKVAVKYEVEQKQLPAFSISIIDGSRVVWSEGFGYQDAEKKVLATKNTVYRVGSVSKLFTDIAVMQLVEQGKLDLDTPVQDYLPQFQPSNPHDVRLTLRQLMTHRSGLVRESPVGNYFDPTEPSLAETVASLNDTSLVYKPESKTKYSNAAIAVVGAVIEKQLNDSHAQQVRKSILSPLKMSDSSFAMTRDVEKQLAAGWMRTHDGRRFEAPKFLLGTGPAGNMYSSVVDLSKFLTCLFDEGQFDGGQILKRKTFRSMLEPIKDVDGKPRKFGIGFHVQDFDGITKIGHGGAVYGFSTQLEALPQRKLGVAAVSSLDGSNGVVRRLADYALRLMLATQDDKALPEYRMTGPIPSERAREIVGAFHNEKRDEFVRVTELNGDVFLRRGSYRYELRSAADNGEIITDDVVGFGTLVKLTDADTLSVDSIPFQRISASPPPAAPVQWKGLIGEYGWDHNTLYILEDAGQLYALIEWFYYYPLKQVGENTFEFPDHGLYHGEGLKFTRDDSGRATKVIAAEVEFLRREVGTKDGETFKITPVKPIDDLRAAALAATPPPESGDFRESELVDVTTLDPTIKLDIRYATTNNFTGAIFYKQPRAFMQHPAAEAVVRANMRLKKLGLGLLIHDAYRPWHVTKMFWDATPGNLKDFVANPRNGSRHNRGCAVDLTLYDLKTGEPIQMVAGYDEFSPRSFPLYPGGTSRQRWYRQLLRQTMEAESFTVYEYEWWHFDFKDWKKYRIGNDTFEAIDESLAK